MRFVFDLGKNPWFILKNLDSIYGVQDEIKKVGKDQTINNIKCDVYNIKARVSYDSGLYGLSTTHADYDYTIWVSKDLKFSPQVSKYALSLLTGNFYNAEVPGLIVKISAHATIGGKEYNVETVLKNSSSETLKTSQVQLPWTDERFTPAITIQRNMTTVGGHDANFSAPHSSFTQESTKDYVKRMDELFKAVTGNVYKKYKHVPLNPYM